MTVENEVGVARGRRKKAPPPLTQVAVQGARVPVIARLLPSRLPAGSGPPRDGERRQPAAACKAPPAHGDNRASRRRRSRRAVRGRKGLSVIVGARVGMEISPRRREFARKPVGGVGRTVYVVIEYSRRAGRPQLDVAREHGSVAGRRQRFTVTTGWNDSSSIVAVNGMLPAQSRPAGVAGYLGVRLSAVRGLATGASPKLAVMRESSARSAHLPRSIIARPPEALRRHVEVTALRLPKVASA